MISSCRQDAKFFSFAFDDIRVDKAERGGVEGRSPNTEQDDLLRRNKILQAWWAAGTRKLLAAS